MKNEEEHEISDREKRGWKEGAKRTKRERPKLSVKQKIEFLKLIAQLTNNSTFERRLGLSPADVEFYKKQFDVENQNDARRLYKRLEIDHVEGREEMIIEQTNHAREAEQVANRRLLELEQKKIQERNNRKVETPSTNAVRKDDAERQKRFEQEQNERQAEALEASGTWQLPLEGSPYEQKGIVDRFRKDIEYCGLTFCMNKYHVGTLQIKAEAARLKLRINWDRIKR